MMYSLGDLQKALASPRLILHELNRFWYTRFRSREYNPEGVDVFAQDWDNLLILDACRYDMFAEQHDLPGELQSMTSQGASTPEFLQANFDGADLSDTVYVTSNPHIYRNKKDFDLNIHTVHNIWKEEGWDDEYGTVLPESTMKHGLKAAETYPNKRLVVHFMQPHYPFITESNVFYDASQAIADVDAPHFWEELMQGNVRIPPEKVWEAYRENLDHVLNTVAEMLETLEGKTVVTSDHGNMIGERARPIPIKEWGHPPGIYTDELVKIPWLTYERGERREIVAEESESEQEEVSEEVVKDRLEKLGYVT